MKAYLSRWVCLDVEANLRRAVEESRQAAEAGASIVVFPEVFLTGYTRSVQPERVRTAFADISGSHPRVVFAFGSFTEDRHNRVTIWRGGGEVARYDKVHLFTPNEEPKIWEPGDRYVAARIDDWTVGLLTRRDHVWRTLLRARAIENGLWVIGCCVAASEHPEERFAGAGNHVFDPHGEPVRTSDDRTYILDPSRTGDLLVDPLETYRAIEEVHVFEAAP